MQISAAEVARLATETAKPAEPGGTDIELPQITADSLPEPVETDPTEVAHYLKVVKEAPDVREHLVMALKERIEKGEYKVSSQEIAEMMLRRIKADHMR